MYQITWPQAVMWIGVAFAAAWAIRSFCRLLSGDTP